METISVVKGRMKSLALYGLVSATLIALFCLSPRENFLGAVSAVNTANRNARVNKAATSGISSQIIILFVLMLLGVLFFYMGPAMTPFGY